MKLFFQRFDAGHWTALAELDLAESGQAQGVQGRCYLQYDVDYVINSGLNATDYRAASCRYPLGFELWSLPSWPAFTLDLLPAGNARRVLVDRLSLRDGPGADAALLSTAQYPPGNLRIQPAQEPTFDVHPGFDESDILQRRDTFIEYAHHHGASVAGSSGAQGDAPKFLLVQDHKQRWHAEGALPDDAVVAHWLVKFPRGRKADDSLILRNEAVYMDVARAFGARVFAKLRYENDVLFVPRFDRRVVREGVERYGLESLCALSGRVEFGARVPQKELLTALIAASTSPKEDAIEFLRRDVLNVMFGNTDNHARNSAVLKTLDGHMTLSPLYDFAPMQLDPEGIARVCRWEDEDGGYPDWRAVARDVATIASIPLESLMREMSDWPVRLRQIHDNLRTEFSVDDEVIERLQPRMQRTLRDLAHAVDA